MKLFSKLHLVGYRVLKDKPVRLFPVFGRFRTKLLRAGIRVSCVVYVSAMFFWSLITASIISVLAVGILYISNRNLYILYGALTGLICGGSIFALFLLYPAYREVSWRTRIDRNLVYLTNYLAMLSSAGATIGDMFLSLAKIDDFYGVRRSARSVIRDVELLGHDIITALNEESKRSPSGKYTTLLQGLIATVRVGGDLKAYLSTMSREFMGYRRRRLEKIVGNLDLAGELFVTALIAFPVIIVTMLAVMSLFGSQLGGGFSTIEAMFITVYLIVPLMGIGILAFINAIMSGW